MYVGGGGVLKERERKNIIEQHPIFNVFQIYRVGQKSAYSCSYGK